MSRRRSKSLTTTRSTPCFVQAEMNWSLLIAALTVLVSVVTYALTRRRELAWKRTEFIVNQAQYFDNDPDLLEVVRILEDRHPVVTLSMIFDEVSDFDH